MAKTADPSVRRRTGWWLTVAGIAAAALVMRIVPMQLGGGLFGRGNYDDGVYFSAAVGFVHGLMPYRDFLLLHPPGILLVLAPFAALAESIGTAEAFAAARIAFMIIGVVNAVLVTAILRRSGRLAALAGGMFYAAFYPAVYVEHTTLLEPLATTCLLGAVGLVSSLNRRSAQATQRLVVAGVLLGLSATLKVWGVAPTLAMAGWVLAVLGARRALQLLAGAVAAATMVCLPFLAAAPAQMWRLVVLAQLGRPEKAEVWSTRLTTIAGLSLFGHHAHRWWWVAAAALIVLCYLAVTRSSLGRLAVTLVAATLVVLFATPSWFVHYAAFSAAPLALVVGTATSRAAVLIQGQILRTVAATAAIAAFGSYTFVVATYPFGRAFPTAGLAGPVAASRTCVTTDDPIVLIELDALQRNLDRRCPLIADLGGYNYTLQIGTAAFRARSHDPRWQRFALTYLRSGDTAVTGTRFTSGFGFSKATATEVDSWPLLGRAGHVTVRHPDQPLRSPR